MRDDLAGRRCRHVGFWFRLLRFESAAKPPGARRPVALDLLSTPFFRRLFVLFVP